MREKGLLLFTLILFLFSLDLFPQRSFIEGFVIESRGDTIFGQLEYRTGPSAYKSCSLKGAAGVTEYTPDQILGYGYIGDRYFISGIEEGVFVEALVLGELSLFNKGDIYYLEKEGNIYKLETKKSVVERKGIKYNKDDNSWQGIVNLLVSDCEPISVNKTMEFKEKSLTEVTVRYNQCRGGEYFIVKEAKPWIKVRAGLKAVLSFEILNNKIMYPYNYRHLEDRYSSVNPGAGVVLSISSPRVNENISILTEINVYKTTFSSLKQIVNTEYHDTYISFTSIAIPLSFKYSFTGFRLSPYLQAGSFSRYNLSYYSYYNSEIVRNNTVNTYTGEALDITPMRLGWIMGCGISYPLENYEMVFGFRLNNEFPDVIYTEEIESKIKQYSFSLIILTR